MITVAHLRAYALARTFRPPTTLGRAIRRLGFIQADPIRAPARAQDLILRHRVTDYRAGDLERRYPTLDVDEDCLVNYGFVPREHLVLMHPRVPDRKWDASTRRRAAEVLALIRERGAMHPRDIATHFAHGRVTNAWGGASNATTRLLDGMHYRGMLRVARRDNGIRVYAAHEHPQAADDAPSRAARADALVALVVAKYAPLPASSLRALVSMLRYGAPHLRSELDAALARARTQLAHTRIDGVDWYWPSTERPPTRRRAPEPIVRLLAPFDPAVWDRRRFQQFWDWDYRFEAYIPAGKRRLGYYALPLLWRDEVIGWGNLSVAGGNLVSEFGYVAGRAPAERAFRLALESELAHIQSFLRLA